MQFSTLTTLFFASLATAAHMHGSHNFPYRRALNSSETISGTAPLTGIISTTAGSEPLTTLTVKITRTRTVLSCSSTVTDCPAAHHTVPVVVTQVIDVTTTVCPVASASSIHSSILASASQNSAIVAPTVTPTAPAGPATSDSVLTYTLGNGDTKTVITTTIKHTHTRIGHTIKTLTRPHTRIPAGGSNDLTTTTLSSTTTNTRYITVQSINPETGNSAIQTGLPGGSNEGNPGACEPVTVTVALSTVTVTETASASTNPLPTGDNSPINNGDTLIGPLPTKAISLESSTTDAPVVVVTTIAVYPIPVYSNGTNTNIPGSSGFVTISSTRRGPNHTHRPHGPHGTGTHPRPTFTYGGAGTKVAYPTPPAY